MNEHEAIAKVRDYLAATHGEDTPTPAEIASNVFGDLNQPVEWLITLWGRLDALTGPLQVARDAIGELIHKQRPERFRRGDEMYYHGAGSGQWKPVNLPALKSFLGDDWDKVIAVAYVRMTPLRAIAADRGLEQSELEELVEKKPSGQPRLRTMPTDKAPSNVFPLEEI